MGALFQEHCYATQAEATDAFFTSVGPQYEMTSGSSQVFYYAKYTTAWYVCTESVVTTGTPTCTTASAPTFPYCDEAVMNPSPSAQFADGVTVGWGIVTAMVLAYSVRLLQKVLL